MLEANRGAGAQACHCERDMLWVRLPLHEMKYLIFYFFHFFALVSSASVALNIATQQALPLEFGKKWGTE